MRYHLFQKFCGKMVKIKKTSFLSTRGAVCFALNCMSWMQNWSMKSQKKSRNKCKKIKCTCCIRAAQDTPAMVAKRSPIAMFIFLLKL